MSHARARIGGSDSQQGSKRDDRIIPWDETDPARAPLRNDVITALQAGLSPTLFFFVFFIGYYELRMAVGATIVMMLIWAGVTFIFTWGRMKSARRRGPTTRGVRGKLRFAVIFGAILGVLTVLTGLSSFSDKTLLIAVGAAAGISAAVILLVLESYAVDVPASDREYEKEQRARFDIQ
jgi:hypothetical protein